MNKLSCASFSDRLDVIEVESAFTRGLPGFAIVGLPSTAIKESTERIRACIKAMPTKKIIINLSPSDLPKNGCHFDLAIALLILLEKENVPNIFVFGELGLDGSVKSTANLFSILLFLSTKVPKAKVLLPKAIATKAAMIPQLEVYSVEDITQALSFFHSKEKEEFLVKSSHPLFQNAFVINGETYIKNEVFKYDFLNIKGQENAKRACLIAALGMHNILFEGSPGCGKSMCAKRLPYILPPQSKAEVLAQNAYLSLDMEDLEFCATRAFRSPHHSSTRASIFGGGTKSAKIGEVALANGGVLFFDEFPHFSKQIIESLREPLEDHQILISRVNSKITYDTKFLFVAAQNPCPCGFAFSSQQACTCKDSEILRYKSRISGPLLDRIDLYVPMDEVKAGDGPSLSSKQMSELVLKAFIFQKQRGQQEFNGKLGDKDLAKYAVLDKESEELLAKAVAAYKLSQRGINKTLKVARSIADLDQSKLILKPHLLESLSYRFR